MIKSTHSREKPSTGLSEMGRIDMFSKLDEFMEENERVLTYWGSLSHPTFKPSWNTLTGISQRKQLPEQYDWIRSPFTATRANHLTSDMEDALVELSCDRTSKTVFNSKTLDEFWISVEKKYPQLSKAAMEYWCRFALPTCAKRLLAYWHMCTVARNICIF